MFFNTADKIQKLGHTTYKNTTFFSYDKIIMIIFAHSK